ncbi:hypothetical protein RvY_02991 [Ramazzottius varieornatus]|uniref:RBR-type E3 ubiquitin transferase n=1 Tax=Ramazzottius varieornatus TaxID=947166 RepID=A0A1D1UW33_RAMVA|nr:hypothetical protein RvY_02991 [Ramazzottius varieornatus]
MGNHRSQLRKRLSQGDEPGALELLKAHDEFRKRLDIRENYEKNDGCSPFHLVCLHGMETLMRTFLNEYPVDLARTNALQENPLHCLCRLPSWLLKDHPQYRGDTKHKCLKLILTSRGTIDGVVAVREAYLAKDLHGNTPLHNAAAHGFLELAEEIVSELPEMLRAKNDVGDTPIDTADRYGQESVARYLESKILVLTSQNPDEEEVEDWAINHTATFDGMKAQEIQHKKDQLVVETSDMLHVPLFTAEALLRTFQWSRQTLLDAWLSNAVLCCTNAGVKPPESLRRRKKFSAVDSPDLELGSPKRVLIRKLNTMCTICANEVPQDEEPVYLACEHDFCRTCWREYLTIKIETGQIYPITCPDFACSILVPCDVVEGLISRDVARKYLQFDIEAFVESNPSMKWCPFAGCGRAVCRPEVPVPNIVPVPHMKPPLETSQAVDCGNGHYFCWGCAGDAHEPCSCGKWGEWHQRIVDVKPEEIRGTREALEEAANSLWLVTNSKPCPGCKSPIQKTDGCNHMKCLKCKHDFCWICSEAWKKHNTATGGYFRCTRFDAVNKAQGEAGKLISAAEEKNRRLNELNRFVQYYGKFKSCDDALKRSMPFIDNTETKIMLLSAFMQVPEDQLVFLRDASFELLKARKVLKGSYVYAYYLEDHRVLFEYMQTELETAVDKLDQMISVRYLRTCKEDVLRATRLVRRKRHEFVVAVSKGLIIPETPPSIRKKRKRHLPGLFGMDFDDVVLQEGNSASGTDLPMLDGKNAWVIDKRGRHANVAALYDWPEYEENEDVASFFATSVYGTVEGNTCARPGCSRPCVRNPRTEIFHRHCSYRCNKLHESLARETASALIDDQEPSTSTTSGERASHKLDLLIAMELSRLQMQRDLENRASSFSSSSSGEESSSPLKLLAAEIQPTPSGSDPALDLAIQLSLQDLQSQRRTRTISEETDDVFAEWATNQEDDDPNDSESIASLTSVDFSLLTANEMLLDHLQKFSDENMLRNIDQEDPNKDKESKS